jgi:hypothetical protein
VTATPPDRTSRSWGRTRTRGSRRSLKVLGALGVCAALGAAPALAAWSTTGTGTATPAARSLVTPAAPAVATATATASSLVVSGTLPAGQLAGTAYTLKRGATNVCTPTATPWTCTDTGLAPATTYSYTLVASLGAWGATSAAGTGTTKCATASVFTATSSDTTPTAGAAFNVTLTAKNCSGVTDTTYTGSKAVTFSGPGLSPSGKAPIYPATVTFANGVGTASVRLHDVETTTITATQGTITGTSPNLTVSAGDPATIGYSNAANKVGAVTIACTDGPDLAQVRSCSQTSAVSSGNGRFWSARIVLLDSWGNPTVNNVGIVIDLTIHPNVGGDQHVTIAQNGTYSGVFSFTLPNGGATRTFVASPDDASYVTVTVTGAG